MQAFKEFRQGCTIFDVVLELYLSLNMLPKLISDNSITDLNALTTTGQKFAYDTDFIYNEKMSDEITKKNYKFRTGDFTPKISDTILIGNQKWTIKNLNVTTYRDGTPIPLVQRQFWAGLTTGAYCHIDDNPANDIIYGKLYNGYAVLGKHDNDPNTANKILAPLNYHIPTDAEWTTLTTYLGGASVSGGKMKSTGATYNGSGLWNAPNTGATNESGFNGLPAGFLQGFNGAFNNQSLTAYFWSSSEFNANNLFFRYLQYNTAATLIGNISKINGFSVRLIKDV